MDFIQIAFLGAAAAVAIPIVIHLVFRQKTRRADLGTLRFLRVVLERNARRRRVMRWLLLALRMACVALLAVLFARPYWRAFHSADAKETVAVLIDRSATMDLQQDGTRLIERAVAETRELIRSAADNTRFEIAFFDHKVSPLAGLSVAGAEAGRSGPGPAVHGFSAGDAPVTSTGASPGRKPVEAVQHKTGQALPQPPPVLSTSEMEAKLAAPAACHGGTDYGAAMDWARDVLAKAPPGPRKLHVFTDLQRSGLAWSEVDVLQDDVLTTLHDLGRSAVNNIAVVEARPERVWLRPNEPTSVHATIHNGGPFGTEELSIVLRLSAGERKLELRDRVKIDAGASESVRFDLPPLAEGAWQGKVLVEAQDDLPLDNERYVEILAARPYQVLLVDGRSATSPQLAATYFLDTSLRLAPAGEVNPTVSFEPTQIAVDDFSSSVGQAFQPDGAPRDAVRLESLTYNDAVRLESLTYNDAVRLESLTYNDAVRLESLTYNDAVRLESLTYNDAVRLESLTYSNAVRPESLTYSKLERFDVIVLADVGSLQPADARRLALFVKGGGGLLAFGGENVTAERTVELEAASLTPGKFIGIRAATDLPMRLQTWDVKHPIFTAFSDPQLGDLRRLAFSAYTEIAPASDAVVLATFRDGKPALIERRLGKGTIVWFASSCDRQWSDWPRSRLYLPFMYQLLGYQTGLTAGGRVREAVLEGKTELAGDTPPGIVERDRFALVINTSPRESETERCPAEEFVQRFGLKLADAADTLQPAATVAAGPGSDMIESEVWHWVALAVLAFLVIESLVANRTAA